MASKQAKLNKLILRVRELENFRIKDPKRFSGEFVLRIPTITTSMSDSAIESMLSELKPEKLRLSTNPSKYLFYNPSPARANYSGGALYSIPELQEILRRQLEINKERAKMGLDPIGSPDPVTGVSRKPIWTSRNIKVELTDMDKYADRTYIRNKNIQYGENFIKSLETGLMVRAHFNPSESDENLARVYTLYYLIKKLKTRNKERLGQFVYNNLRQTDIRLTNYLDSDQDVLELGNEEVLFKYLGISKTRVEKEVKRLIELDKKINTGSITATEFKTYTRLVNTYI